MKIIAKLQKELARYVRNHKYEFTPNGVLFAKAGLITSGFVTARFLRHPMIQRAVETKDPEQISLARYLLNRRGGLAHEFEEFACDAGPNMVVDQSVDHALASEFSGGGQVTTRYLMLFNSNSTPAADWTATNYASSKSVEEFVDYDESTRPAWSHDGVSSKAISNSPGTGDGEFTCNNVASDNLYGAMLLNGATKSANPGVVEGVGDSLLSGARRFTNAPRAVEDDDKVHLTYEISADDSGT